MDANSESRQGVLAVVKTKFVAARILRIKRLAEQLEPTCSSEIPLAAAKTRCPDLLEHETVRYKRGVQQTF